MLHIRYFIDLFTIIILLLSLHFTKYIRDTQSVCQETFLSFSPFKKIFKQQLIVFYQVQVYSKVIIHLHNLRGDPPDKSGTHCAPPSLPNVKNTTQIS